MLIKSKQLKEVEVVNDVLCNKCEKSLKVKQSEDYYGLREVTVHSGFFSAEFPDCTRYTFSLCEECLAELFATFKLPVQVNNE